jgi:hypothetical protein
LKRNALKRNGIHVFYVKKEQSPLGEAMLLGEQFHDAGQLGDCDDDGARLDLGALAAATGEGDGLPF